MTLLGEDVTTRNQAVGTGAQAKQIGVDWRFTTEDARIKLKRLYPQYQRLNEQ